MFASQNFHDFKENVKSTIPLKTSGTSRKGLASRNLNSFTDSSNIDKNKKKSIEEKSCKYFAEKNDVKPKINLQKKKIDLHSADEAFTDIEEMHIIDEPDDDYEDIYPQCERIQAADIDALFRDCTFRKYAELTVDKLPSPLKDFIDIDIPFSPPLPEFKASLFDDTELDLIPLSSNLNIL